MVFVKAGEPKNKTEEVGDTIKMLKELRAASVKYRIHVKKIQKLRLEVTSGKIERINYYDITFVI